MKNSFEVFVPFGPGIVCLFCRGFIPTAKLVLQGVRSQWLELHRKEIETTKSISK
jgi:hypothetical protein